MKRAIASFLLSGFAVLSHAGAMDSLENFIQTARSGHADFTQTVTSPSRNGEAGRTKTSSGTFDFQRPNRFRFEYRHPFEQTLVADGQTLWLYDKDLNQVSSRRQARALAQTPAALIAASPDLQSLRRDFDLQEMPDSGGLQWVQATPKVVEGQVARMRIGFRGNELAALDILDRFGQRSTLAFSNMQLNSGVTADAFRFTPPKGADVVQADNGK